MFPISFILQPVYSGNIFVISNPCPSRYTVKNSTKLTEQISLVIQVTCVTPKYLQC